MEAVIVLLPLLSALLLLGAGRILRLRVSQALAGGSVIAAAILSCVRAFLLSGDAGMSCTPSVIIPWGDGVSLSLGCGLEAILLPPVILALAAMGIVLVLRNMRAEPGQIRNLGLLVLLSAMGVLLAAAGDLVQVFLAWACAGFILSLAREHAGAENPRCGLVPDAVANALLLLAVIAAARLSGGIGLAQLAEAMPQASGIGLAFGNVVLPDAAIAALLVLAACILKSVAWLRPVDGGGHIARTAEALAVGIMVPLVLWQFAPLFSPFAVLRVLGIAIGGIALIASIVFILFPNRVKRHVDLSCEGGFCGRMKDNVLCVGGRMAALDEAVSARLLPVLGAWLSAASAGLAGTRNAARNALGILMGVLFVLGMVFWMWGRGAP